MTTEELVRETVEYYKDHERGVNRDANGKVTGCVYVSKTMNMCAVGRCFNGSGLDELGDHSGSVGEARNEVNSSNENYSLEFFSDYLKPEYQDVSIDVFEALQIFHDEETNWTKYKSRKGYYLSVTGKKYVQDKFMVTI